MDNYLQHTQAGPYCITRWTPVINEAILTVFHKIKITQILKLSMIVDSLKNLTQKFELPVPTPLVSMATPYPWVRYDLAD